MQKILIVDDEKEILNLLEAVLKKEGFRHIYTCATGKDGIHMCR